MEFIFNEESEGFVLKSSKSSHKSLDEFNSVLSIVPLGKCFPCTNFTFRGGKLSGSDIQDFFTLHGGIVRKLSLCGVEGDEVLLGKLLRLEAPNIEHLMLNLPNEIENGEDSVKLFEEGPEGQVQLERLQTLEIAFGCNRILEELLAAAVNLKYFDCPKKILCQSKEYTRLSQHPQNLDDGKI